MRKLPLILLVLLTLPLGILMVSSSAAQQPSTIDINNINDDNFPQLELLVNVQDDIGASILNLTAEDFTVLLDNDFAQVVSVENITDNNLAISVVLVIDTSESMIGTPLEDTKTAALAFVDRLAENDEIAIVDFDSTVKIAQDFTTNLEDARAAIDDLEAGGRTALFDANFNAADLASRANTPRRFVVFLTDGNEFGGLSTSLPESGTQLAADNNIALYTIGLGYSVNEPYLMNMAAQTGGQYYLYPTSANLAELYDYLASYLRTQYIVTVDTTQEPDGADHIVTVSAAGGNGARDYSAIDLYPQVEFAGLPEGPIEEPTTIQINTSFPREVDFTAWAIDGVPIGIDQPILETTDDPNSYVSSYTIDPLAFAPGTHTLSIAATDFSGGTREEEVSFEVAEVPPTFTVSGLEVADVVSDETIDIAIDIESSQLPPQAVIISVDNEEVVTLDEAPYEHTLDVLDLGPGDHTLDLSIVSDGGATFDFPLAATFSVDPALFVTPSPTPTNTPQPTDTPAAEETEADDVPEATDADDSLNSTATAIVAQATRDAEATLEVAQAASDTPEPPPTDTPEPTSTDTPEPSDTPEPEPTDTPEPDPTDTPEPDPTDTPESDASDTPSFTATPVEDATPTAVSVPEEDEGDGSSTLLPIAGIVILLVIVVAGYMFSRRGTQETT